MATLLVVCHVCRNCSRHVPKNRAPIASVAGTVSLSDEGNF